MSYMNNKLYTEALVKTESLLGEISSNYSPAVLSNGLGPESMVLTDLISKHRFNIEIFTLDTGRLPRETYALLQSVVSRYGPIIKVLSPDADEIGEWVQKHGPDAFYQSVDLRKECCTIRKIHSLKKALKGKKAWLTGLRKAQSHARSGMGEYLWDEENHLHKFNPMIDWTTEELWAYIHEHSVPYNELLDKGYKSVGCAPCSRAVKEGEDDRAGRWWWERGAAKECGLHLDPKTGKLERLKT